MKKIKKLVTVTLALSMFLGGLASRPQQSYAASNETYDAWGFFEWVKVKYPSQSEDAELAIKNLNAYPQGFVRGNQNDASSIKHMKESLKLIKQGNNLRVNDNNKRGNKELLVTHQAMAIGISNAANSNRVKNSHLKHFYVGENLAWGYKNPFDGWYYKEKAMYDEGSNSGVGHYLNIINPGYGVTGMGISRLPDDEHGVTASQIFLWKGGLGQEFTVEEYESILDEYIKEKSNSQNTKPQTKPDLNENQVKPNESQNQTKPDSNENQVKPDASQNQTKPDKNENQIKPNMDQNQAKPDENKNQIKPNNQENKIERKN